MRSYAKLNIFLKITGFRGNYHEIRSRFILFKGIFDEIEFVKKPAMSLYKMTKYKTILLKKQEWS